VQYPSDFARKTCNTEPIIPVDDRLVASGRYCMPTEARGRLSGGQRGEVETGLTGGLGQGEAEEGGGEGDAGEDTLVDLGLAGAEETAQLVGAVAHLIARAPLADGHERGEVVGGDDAGQAVGGEGPATAGGSTANRCPATRTRSATAARSFQPGPLTGGRRVGSLIPVSLLLHSCPDVHPSSIAAGGLIPPAWSGRPHRAGCRG